MTAPTAVQFHRFAAADVAADLERWARPYRAVYASSATLPEHTDPPIEDRLAGHVDRPGFELVAAVGSRSEVLGYVYGYRLPTDTPWWEGLEPAPEPALVEEYPGRTVAVCEALVTAAHRRDGLGENLLVDFLRGRSEERATALVALGNTVILDRFTSRGWRSIGRIVPKPGWAPHAALVLPLR